MSEQLTLLDDSLDPAVEVPAEVERPQGSPGLGVALSHGAGGSLATPGLVALGKEVLAAGHLSLRFDMTYRALGRRSPPKAEKAASGYAAVFRSAISSVGPDLKWVAGGRSYGGRVASLAAADGMDAAGLILYSYPLHRPGDPSKARVDHFPRINVPCLFLQGTHDSFCDLEVLKVSLDLIPGGASLVVVEGGEHGLKVAKARSPEAKARSEKDVIASLGDQISGWLGSI